MNNKKIGMAAAIVLAGFFVLIANAQVTVNQTVAGNFTVSNQTYVNQTVANSTISNNNNITAIVNNSSALNQTLVNSTVNQTAVTLVNSTNNTSTVLASVPVVTLSVSQAFVAQGQVEQLSTSISGGVGDFTYYWYEVTPNTNRPVQLTNCNGSGTCLIDTLSGPTGAYSFYVVVGDSEGQATSSQTAMVLVYP